MLLQREFAWSRHSTQHVINNPTWPTEWRQCTPLLALAVYMFSNGDVSLVNDNYDLLVKNTQIDCINDTLGLVDFRKCARMPGTRDVIDWPQASRDGYVLSDVSTVISAYTVQSLMAMAVLANATGRTGDVAKFQDAAQLVGNGMNKWLGNQTTGLFRDGLDIEHYSFHASMFALWAGVVGDGSGGSGSSSSSSSGSSSSNSSSSSQQQKQEQQIMDFLKQKRMAGSVYAAYPFVSSLYQIESDFGNFALEMLTSCDENSWCNMLKQGATATMEAW